MNNSLNKGSSLMKRSFLLLMLGIISLSVGIGVVANRSKNESGLEKVANPVSWSKKAHQGFSMKMWINNQLAMGIEAWGGGGGSVPNEGCGIGVGCDYPAGSASCIEHLFGAGPIIGGMIAGRRYVTEAYRTN